MRKDVILWAGAGQIGMAIARRIGIGKKLIVGYKHRNNFRQPLVKQTFLWYDIFPWYVKNVL